MQQNRLFTPAPNFVTGAYFSPCRTWRYTLHRIWEPGRDLCMFIGLNPSTADETNNDPTITRCQNYAAGWGFGGFVMTNLFAYRATDPRDMKAYRNPIGPENDLWLTRASRNVSLIVAAWGNHGLYQNRSPNILQLFRARGLPVHCLGFTQAGQPKHPLYLRRDLQPIPYELGKGLVG